MLIRLFLILFFIVLFIITGCSSEEIVHPAYESVRTSAPRPEIIDEPECDHFWRNPDCDNPYICLDCGETKGTHTEHEWSTANFQEPSICVNCGEVNGLPLEPGFTLLGYRINTTSGRPFIYETITSTDPDAITTGTVTLLYIDIFESDADHPVKAGYEYITARFLLTFDDKNARDSGFQPLTGQFDFFGFDPYDTVTPHQDLEDSDYPEFKIADRKLNYFGNEYEYYVNYSQVQSIWIGEIHHLTLEYTFLAPAGYDGLVVYISNAANWSDTGSRVLSDNFDDETLFFRLRAQTS